MPVQYMALGGVILIFCIILLLVVILFSFRTSKKLGGQIMRDFGLALTVGISLGATSNNELLAYSPAILIALLIMVIGIYFSLQR